MTSPLTSTGCCKPSGSSPWSDAPIGNADLVAVNRLRLEYMEDLLAGYGARKSHQDWTMAEIQSSPSRPAPRVLCIDDDPDFFRALRIRLESRGICVLRAATGLDGFCSAVGDPADAILLDYRLPNGCGQFVLEQLKANFATNRIPVIVISGSKDRAVEYTLINAGAAKFLHKPLDFEELMNELRKHLTI